MMTGLRVRRIESFEVLRGQLLLAQNTKGIDILDQFTGTMIAECAEILDLFGVDTKLFHYTLDNQFVSIYCSEINASRTVPNHPVVHDQPLLNEGYYSCLRSNL